MVDGDIDEEPATHVTGNPPPFAHLLPVLLEEVIATKNHLEQTSTKGRALRLINISELSFFDKTASKMLINACLQHNIDAKSVGLLKHCVNTLVLFREGSPFITWFEDAKKQ
jgi:hypothetical protein